MPVDTNLSSLVINKLTTAQYQELVENDQVNENELYLTTDSSYPTEQEMNDALAGKQDTLTTNQLDAVNSGITSALVTQIGTNQTDISTLSSIVSNKADAATTLAGYGITNAYTKTEVDVELNNKQNILTAGDNITIVEETSNIEGDTTKYYSYYSGNTVDDGNGNYVILQDLGASNKYLRTTSSFGGSYSLSQFTDPSSTSLTGLKIKFKLKELPIVDDTFSSIVGGAYANFPKTNVKISYNVTNDIITFTNEYYGSYGDSASVMGTYVITDASSKLLNQWHTLNLYKDNNVWHINVDDLGTETVDNSGLYLGINSWGYFFICNAYSANNNQSATNGYFIYDINLLGTGIYRDDNLVLKLTTDGNVTGTIISATVPDYTAGTGISISNGAISVTEPTLQNTATGSNSLTILGDANSAGDSVNIGVGSKAYSSSVAVGSYAKATGLNSVAVGANVYTHEKMGSVAIGELIHTWGDYNISIGYGSTTFGNRTIQIGEGRNDEADTVKFGDGTNNWKLLDLATGKIPADRLPSTAPSIDNVTITENSSNELQASAVMNAKTNVDAMPVWEGTESEWTNGKPTNWYNWKTDVSISGSSSVGNLKTGGNSPKKILYGNGVYICPMNFGSGAGSTANYKYSADGINWVTKTLPGTVQDISFGNGIFFAAKAYSTDIYVSTDGENWNTISLGYQIEGNAISCTFAHGICYIIPYSSDNSWFYSTDGENWVHMTTVFYGNEVIYGNNEYISFGAGNTYLYKSQDGINNWTGVYIYDKISMIGDLVYGNGVYVDRGVNSENTCYVSNDCITWTYIGRIGSSNSCDLTFEDGLFLWPQSFSNGVQTVYYSDDGTNWKLTTNTQTSASYTCRVVNDLLYLLGSDTCFKAVLGQSSVYTLEASPTTTSTVYSEPNTASALTITSVSEGTITLSDNNVYTYTQSGDVTTYETIGDAYPTYLANIEGVGVKKGNTLIANYSTQVQSDWAQTDASAVDYIKNKPTIPTVNDATLTISQNGVLKGTFSANSSTNVDINLDGGSSYTAGTGIDITSNTISVTSPVLTNTATGTNSLTVLGTSASNNYSVNIGNGSQISQDYGVAIGADARSTSTGGVAIGYKTRAYTNSIALGYGTRAFGIKSISIGGSVLNGTADNTIVLGSSNSAVNDSNKFFVANGANLYELLDLTTGKIPNARLDVQETAIDNTTITKNGSDQLQASALMNARTGTDVMPIWQGTEQEWTNGKSTDWYNWITNFTFAQVTSVPNANWKDIAYGNGKFVILSPNATSYSSDGITWSTPTTLSGFDWADIAYGDGKFVIIKWDSSDVVYSYDGITWETTSQTGSRRLNCIAYGNGIFVALQNAGSNGAYSYDGITWTQLPIGGNVWYDVIYANNMFVAIGDYGRVATSTDGINWTTRTTSLANTTWTSIAYGNGKFIVAGSYPGYYYSTDGIDWYYQDWDTSTVYNYVIAFGDNKFVALRSGTILYSVDGLLWETNTAPVDVAFENILYGNDNFVAVSGSNKKIIYSSPQLNVYTLSTMPETTDTVYSAPNTASALTITSVGTGTITLSDNNTYTYTQSGDEVTYQTIGDAYPNYLANINGVGVKIGNTLIADNTDTSGLQPLLTAGTGIDITNDVISATDPVLINKADSSSSVIIGTAYNDTFTTGTGTVLIGTNCAGSSNSVGIGRSITTIGSGNVAVGHNAKSKGSYGTAIGFYAHSEAAGAIQIGEGTNNETDTLYVSLQHSSATAIDNSKNYKLLGSDGKIPSGRLPIATSVSSSSTDDETVSAKLFYDTVGDLETALHNLNSGTSE